jgi:tetratricopeptide (TPR) repeat protein
VTALHYRDRCSIWALLASPVLFMGATLSKETGLAALLVLPVLFLLVPERETSPRAPAPPGTPVTERAFAFLRARLYWLLLFGLYAAAAAGYFWLRHAAGLRDSAVQAPTWRVALGRTAEALTYYLIKVVVPPPQSAFPTHLPETGVVVTVLTTAAVLLLVSVWLWRRGTPLLLIALGWVLLTLPLPLVAAARIIAKTEVAERSLYIPSVGVCLLVGGLFCAGWARRMWRGPVLALALGLTGAYTFGTYKRAQVWQDNVALWSDAIKDDPAAGTPYHELGQAYLLHEEREKGLECFEKAIERYASAEGRALAWNSKGTVLMHSDPPEAARAFQKAIDERPSYATPYFNLGLMGVTKADQDFARTKKYNADLLTYSQRYFAQAITCNRLYTWAYLELGKCQSRIAVVHIMAGEKEPARQALRGARTNIETAGKLDPHGVHAGEAAALLDQVDQQLEKLGP